MTASNTSCTVAEIVSALVAALDNARSAVQLEAAIADWQAVRESYYASRCTASRHASEYETRGVLSGFGPGAVALAALAVEDEDAFVLGTADAARSAARRLVLLTDRLVRWRALDLA